MLTHESPPTGLRLNFFLVAAVLIAADQALKMWVSAKLALGQSMVLIPQYFALTHVRNKGGAWSLLWGQMPVLIAVSSIVCGYLIYYAVRKGFYARWQAIALGFLLGGAAGNLIDRARLGEVVDMFNVMKDGHNIFPVFNIADISINVGVGLLLLMPYIFKPKEEARPPAADMPTDKSAH